MTVNSGLSVSWFGGWGRCSREPTVSIVQTGVKTTNLRNSGPLAKKARIILKQRGREIAGGAKVGGGGGRAEGGGGRRPGGRAGREGRGRRRKVAAVAAAYY